MSYFLFVLVVARFIGLSLVGLSFLIRFAGCLSLEKITPFECGFDPKSRARIPFSLRFFLLAVLFLVFDVEVVLLFPLPLFGNYGVFSVVLVGCLVVLILFFGLLYEWWEGALDWA